MFVDKSLIMRIGDFIHFISCPLVASLNCNIYLFQASEIEEDRSDDGKTYHYINLSSKSVNIAEIVDIYLN